LFRRTKSESSQGQPDDADDVFAVQKKGRPTPRRREAEAANKAKAKVPRTRKEQAAARRRARTDAGARMREAMHSGDDRYLPARDQGPARRFIRDYVDSSLMVLELLLPLMFVLLVVGWFGGRGAAAFSNLALLGMILVILVETVRLRFALRRELTRRFPDDPSARSGATMYAVMRALQVRWWRKPDRQVRVGQRLPERYR
jgi:hypothetical protein